MTLVIDIPGVGYLRHPLPPDAQACERLIAGLAPFIVHDGIWYADDAGTRPRSSSVGGNISSPRDGGTSGGQANTYRGGVSNG